MRENKRHTRQRLLELDLARKRQLDMRAVYIKKLQCPQPAQSPRRIAATIAAINKQIDHIDQAILVIEMNNTSLAATAASATNTQHQLQTAKSMHTINAQLPSLSAIKKTGHKTAETVERLHTKRDAIALIASTTMHATDDQDTRATDDDETSNVPDDICASSEIDQIILEYTCPRFPTIPSRAYPHTPLS